KRVGLFVLVGVGFLGLGLAAGLFLQKFLLPPTPTVSHTDDTPSEPTESSDDNHGIAPGDDSDQISQLKNSDSKTESQSDTVVNADQVRNRLQRSGERPTVEHPTAKHPTARHPSADAPEIDHPESSPTGSAMAETEKPSTEDPSKQLPAALFSTGMKEETPEEALAQADLMFQSGNYRYARDRYLPMLADSTGAIDVLLLLKLALCEESLGNRKAAQAGYREILELTPEPSIRRAAVQGQARLWEAGGQSELATSALFRNLIEEVAAEDRALMLHQLAGLIARRAQPVDQQIKNSPQLYRDDILIPPDLIVRPAYILESVMKQQERKKGPHVPIRQELIVVRQPRMVPDETIVSLQYERSSALDVLDRTLRGTGFTARLTQETTSILTSHTLEPDCQEIPLSLVLDCVLDPLELVWELQETSISIRPANAVKVDLLTTHRQQVALRLLRFACAQSPEHPDASASFLELARIGVLAESRVAGIQALEQTISKYPRSDYVPLAWFNLGKLLIQEGRPADAAIAFLRAADMVNGESLEPASYLYLGRISMENDDPRAAVGPFTRALSLSTGTPHEGIAALQLSSVYLTLNHFQRANSVLLEHLIPLEQPGLRDQGAFLSCLIHYRSAADEHERFRTGTTLLSTMTHLKPDECFGKHWFWLMGCACRDTGLTQAAVQLFCRCIESSYPFPLQNRMRVLLLEDAPEQLSRLPSRKWAVASQQVPEAFQIDSLLVEAEATLLQRRFDDSHRLCREVLRKEKTHESQRRKALQLLGQVLQAQGRYEESVQCFTGIVPKEIPPEPGPGPSAALDHTSPERGIRR
ncbi:MAG TPA: tetratricopeptide repeat protein, partial [Planctomicrobium sp.]|nr:tetratricopeptide repeat protein [Planctomicrobium sp.]